MKPVNHGSTTYHPFGYLSTKPQISQPNHNDSRPTPCLSSSQDNCSGVDVLVITQSTYDTNVRVVTTPHLEFDQTRHRGVNPTFSRSTSEDNNNGAGVKADTLCSTGANVKVSTIAEAFWTTDQQSHPGDYEPWTYPIAFYFNIHNRMLFYPHR